jgi:hypothetical protein
VLSSILGDSMRFTVGHSVVKTLGGSSANRLDESAVKGVTSEF